MTLKIIQYRFIYIFMYIDVNPLKLILDKAND